MNEEIKSLMKNSKETLAVIVLYQYRLINRYIDKTTKKE